jgi:RNA polymerase sigma factor (sigma-70 family)
MSAAQDQPDVARSGSSLSAAEALSALRLQHHSGLRNALVARGASAVEAEDLLADLWGDCVRRSEAEPCLLDKYSGKCPVQAWLLTVATHRLLDLKRRQKHRGQMPGEDAAPNAAIERWPGELAVTDTPATALADTSLVVLLRESLRAAFARCPADALLMLRLVFLNGLSQREVGRMWGWHESKVSRVLSQAMTEIEELTLAEIRRRDPWLQLAWADLVELCASQQVGFL